jgi:hypothetical protein
MISLGTKFEKRAKWQESVEEPTAKNFVARKVCTIERNKVQVTIWNVIKCKEHLRSYPEAVVRQATINHYLQDRKSLGDSLPELYCVDLAEAMSHKKMSVRKFCVRRKGMICPTGHLHEKPLAKGGTGKEGQY